MRIGIWGTSLITNYHIDALRSVGDIEIIGVHGTHVEAGQAISNVKKIPFLMNLDDFFKLKPEMVIITNSVDKHWLSIKKLLLDDIYIICEKPLLANRIEFNEFSEALKKGRFNKLNVIAQKKYDPAFLDLVEKSNKSQSPKYIKIHIRKDKNSASLESLNASRQLVYSQLPHALDMLLSLTSSPLRLESLLYKKMFNLKKIDYLLLSFSGENVFGTIEIESFHQKNFPNKVTVTNSMGTFHYPSIKKWTAQVFKKKQNKNDDTVLNLKSMYLDFFDKIRKQESVMSEVVFKADILTKICSLIEETGDKNN